MLFNSLQFFIFFPIVSALFFVLPHKFRWFMLLAASCYFYMAFIPVYILILFITITIDYFAGILIEDTTEKYKKIYLIISIISTCLVLFIFKYFNFFNANLTAIANFFHWNYSISSLKIILPIGLSFHTFQSLSYVIEVYRGKQKAERNFGIYSLYVMFYPQLVAGPIERPQNLLHQFHEEHRFDYQKVSDGLKLMIWGFFKKMVIADRLAVFVNAVYSNPTEYTGLPLILATYFFAFQIYCDFSGYSDIAIGAAQVMGFKLMDNFNRPYFSKSIAEFWKRWHISLSTWFKDYLYIPLGGNRVNKKRIYFNLFFVFFVSGIWHGANWTFILWGALHGCYLIFSLWSEKLRKRICGFIKLNKFPKIHKYLKIFITFHLVLFAWVFFRANSLSEAIYVIKNMFNASLLNQFKEFYWLVFSNLAFINGSKYYGVYSFEIFLSFLSIIFMEFIHMIQRHGRIRHMLAQKPVVIRWALLFFIILAIFLLGMYGQQDFIYFQF